MQNITINIDLCSCYTVDKEFVNLAAQNAEGVGVGRGVDGYSSCPIVFLAMPLFPYFFKSG